MNRKLILAIGSNFDEAKNIALAQSLLRNHFTDLQFTRKLVTQPVITDSCPISKMSPFVNLLAYGTTEIERQDVDRLLKMFESMCGNTSSLRLKGNVAIDIDLLQLDNQRYHKDDWQREYIVELMKEIPLFYLK